MNNNNNIFIICYSSARLAIWHQRQQNY